MSESETITPELTTSEPPMTDLAESTPHDDLPLSRRSDLVRQIWETLDRTWFLSAVGCVLVMLYLTTIFLPQMPGQLQNDPTMARRWILQISENYGPLGNAFRALGLFNVLNSPLLQLLLIALGLILLIRLGDQIATTWRLYQLPQEMGKSTAAVGMPLPLSAVRPIYRLRQIVDEEMTQWREQVKQALQQQYQLVEERTLTVRQSWPPRDRWSDSPEPTADEAGEELPQDVVNTTTEHRLLARSHLPFALLRLLLFLGLFLAFVAIWIIVLWGWQIKPDPLAPGADYRSALHGLIVQYDVVGIADPAAGATGSTVLSTTASTTASPIAMAGNASTSETTTNQLRPVPHLTAIADNTTYQAELGAAIRMDWGQTVITSKSGPPALYLRAQATEPQLSRVGQSQTVPTMGLIFPSPGSEESIVVAQALGLRIIRLSTQEGSVAEETFLAEVYDRNNTLIDRLPIKQTLTAELQAEEETIAVEFIVLPSMAIEVSHRPAIWLLWPALVLTVAGLAGYSRTPGFVLWQLAPWPKERAIVIVQSDQVAGIALAATWIEEGRA